MGTVPRAIDLLHAADGTHRVDARHDIVDRGIAERLSDRAMHASAGAPIAAFLYGFAETSEMPVDRNAQIMSKGMTVWKIRIEKLQHGLRRNPVEIFSKDLIQRLGARSHRRVCAVKLAAKVSVYRIPHLPRRDGIGFLIRLGARVVVFVTLSANPINTRACESYYNQE